MSSKIRTIAIAAIAAFGVAVSASPAAALTAPVAHIPPPVVHKPPPHGGGGCDIPLKPRQQCP